MQGSWHFPAAPHSRDNLKIRGVLLKVCRFKGIRHRHFRMPSKRKPLVEFGRRVRDKRIAMGLSQEALAAECDLHRTYIGSVERGERNVSLINLLIIARALGIDTSSLVRGLQTE